MAAYLASPASSANEGTQRDLWYYHKLHNARPKPKTDIIPTCMNSALRVDPFANRTQFLQQRS